jgi:hypothetical protein
MNDSGYTMTISVKRLASVAQFRNPGKPMRAVELKDTQKLLATLFGCACFMTLLPTAPAQTWTPTTASSSDWLSLASSADGSRLLAGSATALCLSTNAGATWTTNKVRIWPVGQT